jgi:hypothetical protein
VKTPVPGPNSTMQSAVLKSIGSNILAAKKEELGDNAPMVPVDFKTSEINFFLLTDSYLFISAKYL